MARIGFFARPGSGAGYRIVCLCWRAADGGGGAVVVWEDWRSGNHDNLLAQRIDAGGSALWGGNGV